MRGKTSGFFFMFIIAFSIVAVVALSIVLNQSTSTPVVEVKGISINPSSISSGSQTSLTFTLKNEDSKTTHYITLYFDTSSSITFWMGVSPLPTGAGEPYFTATLDPSQQSTFYVTVQGSLPSQTTSSTFPIVLNFFVDGKQFDSEKTSITVRS
jgi:hypothetical protein